MRSTHALLLCCLAQLAACQHSPSGIHLDSTVGGGAGVVSFVQVTTDNVADVSSLEAWQRTLDPQASDADRAQAVWKTVVAFRHQDEPPREFIDSDGDGHVHDPIRLFNVYGYGQCDCASAAVEALGRIAGLPARGWELNGHTVPELFWGGAWHLYDAGYVAQFPLPDGSPAGVDDVIAAVDEWLSQNPGLQGDFDGLDAVRASGAWRQGPPLLAACPFYSEDGLFPAHVQGWASTMVDFDGSARDVTEHDYTLGYRVNVQLRSGERLTRNWSNTGQHVNDDQGLECNSIDAAVGQDELAYSPGYGDLAPGRVGNGTLEYQLPLDPDQLAAAALSVDNLAIGGPDARVAVADPSRPGVLVVRMPSSYVYLRGTLGLEARIGCGGRIAIAFSRNHGLDWTTVATVDDSGSRSIDLTPWVRRHYDYRMKIELQGAGTGIDSLRFEHTVQHSQRALPALVQGDNQVHFSAGPDEGTITLEGSTDPTQGQTLAYGEFHPVVEGLIDAPLQIADTEGAITFPVSTPGDLVRLRFGTFYRARDPADGWDYQVSFDGGEQFVTVDRAAGPTVGDGRFVTFDQVPPGTRTALVRFAGVQKNTTAIFDFRIDADYLEPSGTFRPVQVTYRWNESGRERTDVHVATARQESWVIHCDETPRMESLAVELAP